MAKQRKDREKINIQDKDGRLKIAIKDKKTGKIKTVKKGWRNL